MKHWSGCESGSRQRGAPKRLTGWRRCCEKWRAPSRGHGRQAIAPARRGRIPVRTAHGTIQLIAHHDIDYVEASGDGVNCHVGKTVHRINRTMGEITAMLDGRRFVRIHRSTIVNIERIRELQPYFHGEYIVVLRDGTKLKLSRGQRGAVSRLMGRENR